MAKCNNSNLKPFGVANDSDIIYTGPGFICGSYEIEAGMTLREILDIILPGLCSDLPLVTYNISVIPVPANAVVTINGVETQNLDIDAGDDVLISVSAPGYATYTNSFVATSDLVLNIQLESQGVLFSVTTVPQNASVSINGENTNSVTLAPGSTANVVVSAEGYATQTQTVVVTPENNTLNVVLSPENEIQFYFGEIGFIGATTPSGITQTFWDANLKPNGYHGHMHLMSESSIPVLEQDRTDASGFTGRWWIIMVPNENASQIAGKSWYRFDDIAQQFVQYDGTTYTGNVVLDGINYAYSAINITSIYDIRFS